MSVQCTCTCVCVFVHIIYVYIFLLHSFTQYLQCFCITISVILSVRIYIQTCICTSQPRTFLDLLSFSLNCYSFHISLCFSSFSTAPLLPGWCIIISSYLFFCHTQLHSGESSVDVIISDNSSVVQQPPTPPSSPDLTTLHHIQYNCCSLKKNILCTVTISYSILAPPHTDSHDVFFAANKVWVFLTV